MPPLQYVARRSPYVDGTLPDERVSGRAPGPAPFLPNASLVISARPASEPMTLDASSGIIRTFWFGDLASASSLHVVVGDEIVDRLGAAAGDGLADHLRGLGLGLGGALAGLGVAEGGLLAAFGGEHDGLLLALGLQDGGLTVAFRLQDLRALVAFRLHLARHAVDEIARRGDVLDLDTGDLDAPRLGGGIDHLQQARVDLVAVGEQLVEVHGAHDGADVGHGEVDDGGAELVDLVGGLGGVQHLIEVHAIDGDHGVVLGDDVLRGDVDHLLLHVHLGAEALHHRDQNVQAGHERARIAAERLDRVVVALGDDLDRGPQRDQGQHDHEHDEDFEAAGEWVHDRARSVNSTCNPGLDRDYL
jgi:hypothetical protein